MLGMPHLHVGGGLERCPYMTDGHKSMGIVTGAWCTGEVNAPTVPFSVSGAFSLSSTRGHATFHGSVHTHTTHFLFWLFVTEKDKRIN